MNRSQSIRVKAAFLMIVFFLNTVIGFACSIGIDLGFNTTHHHDEDSSEAPSEHLHTRSTTNDDHHKSKESKDHCCNDGVIKFSQLEKSIPQPVNLALNPVFFTIFLASFYDVDFLLISQVVPNVKYFCRSYHPPIKNIRIAIQSFQI
jgi:hypothetical protein